MMPLQFQMSILRAIAVFFSVLMFVSLCGSQIIMPGQCPDVKAMENFDPARYLGKWYEAEKYFFLFEFGGKCVTADYKLRDDGAIRVLNKQIDIFSGIQKEIKGEATQVGRSDEAKLSVRFPTLPVDVAAPYWVVDTDYDNYAVVWSCYEFGIFHTVNSWILTRQQNPPKSVLDAAYDAIDKNRISRKFFLKTDQSDCTNFDE